MKVNLYSVVDIKSETHNAPFPAPNHEVAVRSFGDAVVSSRGLLHDHPEDFALYHVGEFDAVDGFLRGLDAPVLIASGSQVVRMFAKKDDLPVLNYEIYDNADEKEKEPEPAA